MEKKIKMSFKNKFLQVGFQNEGITNQNGALVVCYWFILPYCPKYVYITNP